MSKMIMKQMREQRPLREITEVEVEALLEKMTKGKSESAGPTGLTGSEKSMNKRVKKQL